MKVLFVAFVIFAIAVAKEEDSKFPKVEKIIKDLSPEQRTTLRELTQDQQLIDQVKELNIEEMGALVEKLKVKSSQAKVSPKVKKILDQLTDEQKTALQEIVSDEELFGKIMNLNKDEQKSFVGEIKKESSDVKGSAEKKEDKAVKKEKTEKEVKKTPKEDKEKEKEKKKESGRKERKVVEKEVKKTAEDDEKKTVKKEVKKSAEDDEKKTVTKEVKKSAEDDEKKTVKKEVKKSAKKEAKNFEEFSKSLSEEQKSTLNEILQDETKSETLVGLKKKDMDKLKTAIESSIKAKGSATQQQNLSPEAQRIVSELTPEQKKVVGRVIADEKFFGRIMSLKPTELQGLFQAVRAGTEPQNPEIKKIFNEFTPKQREVLHELFQNMAVVNRIKNLPPADLHALAAYFKSKAEGSQGGEGSKGGMSGQTSERDAVYEVISKLTPEQREALRKYFMEEWSQGSKQNVAASQQGARQPFPQQQQQPQQQRQQPQQQQQQATWSKEDIFNRVMTLPLDQKRMIAAWIFAEPMERQRVNVNPEYHQFLNRLSEDDKAELGFYIVGEMDVPEHIKEKVKGCTDDERRQLLEYFSRPETRQTVGERIRSKLTGLSRLDQILLLKCLVTPECSGSTVDREQTYPIRQESAENFPQQGGRQQESMKGDAFDRLVSRVAQFTQSRQPQQSQQSGSSEIDNRAQQIMQQADERASQIMMQAEQQIRQLYQQQQSQRSGTQMRN